MKMPGSATETEYRIALSAILQAHDTIALERLRGARDNLPVAAKKFLVGIHPAQDGEGYFDVTLHLHGPDLYVLNRAIAPYRSLFSVRSIDGSLEPDVPLFSDPYEVGFSVNDKIVDICMDWIEQLWAKFGGAGIPAFVFGAEGYGSVEKKPLLP